MHFGARAQLDATSPRIHVVGIEGLVCKSIERVLLKRVPDKLARVDRGPK
jgi:hypothetical protein